MNDKFPEFKIDWNDIDSLAFTVNLETKIREFQCEVLSNIVFTNQTLFYHFQIETESLEDLFFLLI